MHPAPVTFLVVFTLLLLGLFSGILRAERFPVTRPSEAEMRSFVYQGRRRTYLVHIPERVNGTRGLPLVLVLHGGGGTGRAVAELTGFSALADERGFIVVYPEAVNRHWNDGRGVRQFRAHREGVDDVGFCAALIDTLVREFGVDPHRVYAAGMSNGGMMCQRLGCELSRRLAAIATVGASLPEPLAKSRPEARIPVLMINGSDDPVVPFAGGGVGLGAKRGRVISVPATVEFWVRANRCNPVPEREVLKPAEAPDTLAVEIIRYRAADAETEVVLYTVVGGGHTWPGGRARPRRFGKKTDALKASEVIWEFFERHRR